MGGVIGRLGLWCTRDAIVETEMAQTGHVGSEQRGGPYLLGPIS